MSRHDTHGVLLLSGIRHLDGYLPFLREHPALEIVGFADRPGLPTWQREHNLALAESEGLAYSEDIDGLLADPAVAIVVVTSEATRHAELALRAIEAGKHVLIDKPMAVSIAEVDHLIAAARAAGVKVSYVNRTFSPAVEHAREVVATGTIGLPRQAHLTWLSAGALDPAAEATRLVVDPSLSGGGELINFLGYPVDYLRYITGLEVESVYASTSTLFNEAHRAHGVEDFGLISLNLQRGVLATVTVGRTATRNRPGGAECTIRLVGSYGAATFDEERPRLDVLSNSRPEASRLARGGSTGPMLRGLIDDFVRAVEDDRQPRLGPADWRQVLAVILAAQTSARTGEVVTTASELEGAA